MGIHKGDTWEGIINLTNEIYKKRGIAIIEKIPTPIKVIRKNGVINKAFFEKKSIVDYLGVYKSKAICFEAKETAEVNGFPLKNIKDHQFDFMRLWVDHGGIAFVLTNFKKLESSYVIPFDILSNYYIRHIQNKGKRGFGSIPLDVLNNECFPITLKGGLLDYLAVIL